MDDGYQWLETLHHMHYDQLLRLARNRLRQGGAAYSEAEDIVQQAFLLAAEKDISRHEAPLRWLIKTVDNLCRRCSTRTQQDGHRRRQLPANQDPTVFAVNRNESPTTAREVMILVGQTLHPEEWSLLAQYSMSGEATEDLAQQHGIDLNTLRVRICRLRKRLLAEYYGS